MEVVKGKELLEWWGMKELWWGWRRVAAEAPPLAVLAWLAALGSAETAVVAELAMGWWAGQALPAKEAMWAEEEMEFEAVLMLVAEPPACREGGDLQPGSHPYACTTETLMLKPEIQ